MKTHFDNEVSQLKNRIIDQTALAETTVRRALQAFFEQNEVLALDIINADDIMDQEEVQIEEECLKVLALHQPVAGDLRYIVTLLKVNGELERIGDLAVNIAERAVHLAQRPEHSPLPDFSQLQQAVSYTLKTALDALLTADCSLAEKAIRSDDNIDDLHRRNYQRLEGLIRDFPQNTDILLDCLSVSRNLEHIGDCCTNIGEDVVYLLQGKIIRHDRSIAETIAVADNTSTADIVDGVVITDIDET